MERALFLEPGQPWPAGETWRRLYFGSEFCPWLLPTPRELEAAMEEGRRRGMAVTLATPHLSDEALEAAGLILRDFTAAGGKEVVVNDVGLLELIREEKLSFHLSLGRLLVKCSAVPGGRAPGDRGRYLAAGSLDSRELPVFLGGLGISRVETDGVHLPSGAPGSFELPISFHHPYGFVTLAARCPWRFDGRRWGKGPCPRPCREGEFEMVRREDGCAVVFRGGAQFFLGTELPGDLASRGVDRLVFHPRLEAA